MKFGLKEKVLDAVKECLKKYPEIEVAIIYGSRAKGNYKNGSDIDLTLKGHSLTLSNILKLENEIDDLLLPYKFDISIFHKIDDQDLIDHIERAGKVFYSKKT